MRSPVVVLARTLLLAGVGAFAFSACASDRQGAVPSVASAPETVLAPQKAAKISTTPAKLNFTTTPTLKLTIKESKYTGKFTLTAPSIVKLSSKTPKGPTAKVTVTAVTAGSGSITITDSNGGKATVPVTVTQGVIIIQ